MDFAKHNIKIPSGVKGNTKVICPACTPHARKPANRNSKDLSVNVDEGVWNCHNCAWSGSAKAKDEKTYFRPVKVELPLSAKAIDWFKARGINETTLKHFQITEKNEYMPQVSGEMNCILFPYIKHGEWVNFKYRDGKKNFKLVKGAELVIFHHDGVFGKKKVVITEGEIDAMSVYESGFFDVCSVPNGAAIGNQRLEYLDNSWLALSEAEQIIIATDNDDAGFALKKELIRRLGRERCMEITYPDGCKDLNEVIVGHGSAGVWDCINKATILPVEGIYRLKDFIGELDHNYQFGYEQGVKAGFPIFDQHLNFAKGQLTIVTGTPNSGKSAFVDQLLILLAQKHKWRVGACSFENQPIARHASNLLSCSVGRPFYRKDENEKMTPKEYVTGTAFLQDNFFWFKLKDEDLSIDGILSRAKQLVSAYGINALLIDPYNYIEHNRPSNQTETEYVSETLTKICNFAKDYQVHVFLIAHPTKIKKNLATKDFEIPTLYDISGSANFFNKCDNGITVYRERATNKVIVYIQKVRFFNNGKLGYAEFSYDVHTGRYTELESEDTFAPPGYKPIPSYRDITEPNKLDETPF